MCTPPGFTTSHTGTRSNAREKSGNASSDRVEGLDLPQEKHESVTEKEKPAIMQQVKTYKPGFLKGSARDQFFRDLGKMVKAGWHVHTITHDGVGTDQVHSSQLKVLYDTNLSARSELGTQDHFGPARPDSSRGQPDAGEQ